MTSFLSAVKSKVSDFMAKHGTKAYATGLTIGTTATALTTSAFAEGETASSVTSLVDVQGITSLLSSVFSFMTSNPLLSFYIGVGVISAVCYIFRRLRKTSH